MNETVLTVAEVALTMKISKPLVYAELHRKGGIPHFRIGRRILIPREKFLAWLDNQAEPEAHIEFDGQMSLFDI